jgi:hypothetical protein
MWPQNEEQKKLTRLHSGDGIILELLRILQLQNVRHCVQNI